MNVPQVRKVEEIERWIVDWLARELKTQPDKIRVDEEFVNLGLSSRKAVLLSGALEDWLGRELDPSAAWDHPTIAELAKFLAST